MWNIRFLLRILHFGYQQEYFTVPVGRQQEAGGLGLIQCFIKLTVAPVPRFWGPGGTLIVIRKESQDRGYTPNTIGGIPSEPDGA